MTADGGGVAVLHRLEGLQQLFLKTDDTKMKNRVSTTKE